MPAAGVAVTSPWHVAVVECTVVGRRRRHHATSCCCIPATSFRGVRGASSLRRSFTSSWCSLRGVRACVCVHVPQPVTIMNEYCRKERGSSVLQGRSISTIHSSLITTAELRKKRLRVLSALGILLSSFYFFLFFSLCPLCHVFFYFCRKKSFPCFFFPLWKKKSLMAWKRMNCVFPIHLCTDH